MCLKKWFQKLDKELREGKLSKNYTFGFLLFLFIFILILIVVLSSKIIEGTIIWSFILISLFGVYSILFIRIICVRSEVKFVRENPVIFQLTSIILLSILLGVFVTTLFYPTNSHYDIKLGPRTHFVQNDSYISPSIIIECSMDPYKNLIWGKRVECFFSNSIKGQWNDTEIKNIEFKAGQETSYFTLENKGFSYELFNNTNYSIRAIYDEGDISLNLLSGVNILTLDKYNELRQKRIGLIGIFIVFSIGALTSFLKNITGMIKESSKK